jgi:hypothetical protein
MFSKSIKTILFIDHLSFFYNTRFSGHIQDGKAALALELGSFLVYDRWKGPGPDRETGRRETMNKYVFCFAIVALLFATAAAWAEPNIKEGKWEITATPEVKGMAGMKIPPQVNTQCVTKKDTVPQDFEKNPDCKVIDKKISGDTVSWIVKCSGKEGAGESRGTITYKGDRYDGAVTTITSRPGEEKMEMKIRLSGRRIGDCK